MGATEPVAGRPTADFAPVGRGGATTDHPWGTGPGASPAGKSLGVRGPRGSCRAASLGTCLAGSGLGTGRVRVGGPALAADRGAGRRQDQFAFANLPVGTSRLEAVRLWKSRWPVEQGYQQMKEELGLNHFEGRSWRGFHHHALPGDAGVWVSDPWNSSASMRSRRRRGKKWARAADNLAGDSPRAAEVTEAEGPS